MSTLNECSICNEPYVFTTPFRQALCLPCGHSACRSCLTRIHTAHCPSCRAPFTCNVATMAPNYTLHEVLAASVENLASGPEAMAAQISLVSSQVSDMQIEGNRREEVTTAAHTEMRSEMCEIKSLMQGLSSWLWMQQEQQNQQLLLLMKKLQKVQEQQQAEPRAATPLSPANPGDILPLSSMQSDLQPNVQQQQQQQQPQVKQLQQQLQPQLESGQLTYGQMQQPMGASKHVTTKPQHQDVHSQQLAQLVLMQQQQLQQQVQQQQKQQQKQQQPSTSLHTSAVVPPLSPLGGDVLHPAGDITDPWYVQDLEEHTAHSRESQWKAAYSPLHQSTWQRAPGQQHDASTSAFQPESRVQRVQQKQGMFPVTRSPHLDTQRLPSHNPMPISHTSAHSRQQQQQHVQQLQQQQQLHVSQQLQVQQQLQLQQQLHVSQQLHVQQQLQAQKQLYLQQQMQQPAPNWSTAGSQSSQPLFTTQDPGRTWAIPSKKID